jgi:hypothetical protein
MTETVITKVWGEQPVIDTWTDRPPPAIRSNRRR